MLKEFPLGREIERPSAESAIESFREKLSAQQLLLKEKKLPVILLIEGWGASGKGSLIGRLIRYLDPRFYTVCTRSVPSDEELRKPFLWHYFTKIPQAGKIVLFDSGWMEETVRSAESKELKKKELAERLDGIRIFERQLVENGYLVIKLFLHISKEEQKKRLEALDEDKNTEWRVTKNDWQQNKHYEKHLKRFDKYLEATSAPWAPWHILDATNRKEAELAAFRIVTESIEHALERRPGSSPLPKTEQFPLVQMPLLSKVSLDKTVRSDEEYRTQLKSAQKRLRELHNVLYRKKIPLIIVYEGWDAAGKGGNIKRLASALDPRGAEVHPIAAPESFELSRHYLWRFWTRLPKTGHVAIFDRSWYGRVMVERLEGLCSEADWKRAYYEMNEFERELVRWGAIVIKFWIHIDPDTQLERFQERQNTPEKRWKITDEDWRNREKWPQYEKAVNEMLRKTSTEFAPWYIVESKDKRYARLKALNTVIQAIETRIQEEEK
ncbi:polyphosphate:AMP phosphotransferase [Anaeromassilibacillus sp. An200]|uniref:polyphosphate:AMP phosphotransferase n=1 Tax=Anaeromassilibacillus sp. An200 TaxID=1965587 RepID=UPI000B37CB34|nr:polyphosphate:AMP phosphotransferase [Anaeromassilibacillus sp. An200]OUP12895.1 polyphosphate:AMP phosphotransferase [Anaeromassilibacillus sp. An200]